MSTLCVICSDNLHARDHPVATTCGHIYHCSCISKWLRGNTSCPECRATVKEHKLVKLFFNIQDNDLLPSESENETESLRKACAEKDTAIESLNEIIKGLREYASNFEAKYDKDRRKYQDEIERLQKAVRHLSPVEKKVNKLEHENRQMRNNLERLKDVQLLVSGCQNDVQDMVDKCGEERDFQQLATLCVLLKREMNKALESKSKLREDVAVLTKQKGLLGHEVQQSKKVICDLKQRIKSLEDDVSNIKQKKKEDTTLQGSSIELDILSKPEDSNNHSVSYERASTSKSSVILPKSSRADSRKNAKRNPITITTIDNERKKFPLVVMSRISVDACSSSVDNTLSAYKRYSSLRSSASRKDDDSSIQIGYNGLGGHSKTILPYKKFKS